MGEFSFRLFAVVVRRRLLRAWMALPDGRVWDGELILPCFF